MATKSSRELKSQYFILIETRLSSWYVLIGGLDRRRELSRPVPSLRNQQRKGR